MSFTEKRGVIPKSLACIADKVITKKVKNIVTIAGAGISTSAGISDCRTPESGLYSKVRKYKLKFADVMWDKDFFHNHPEKLYSILKDNILQNSLKPTLTHCFIKLLENKGVLLRHFTQNIDGMELMTGLSPDKLVEAHGTMHRSYCISCKEQYNYQWLVKKMDKNPVPFCDSCGGLVRPDIVLFGERLSQDFDLRAFVDLPQCDLLIVLGTSLQVEPFASIIHNIPDNCPRLLISRVSASELKSGRNQKLRGYEREVEDPLGSDTVIMGDCDASVHEFVRQLGWEDDLYKVRVDVKLRKFYGNVSSIDVGVQTLPCQYDTDSTDTNFLHDERNHQLLKCADFRARPKKIPLLAALIPAKEIQKEKPSKPINIPSTVQATSTHQSIGKVKLPGEASRPKKVLTEEQRMMRLCHKCSYRECT